MIVITGAIAALAWLAACAPPARPVAIEDAPVPNPPAAHAPARAGEDLDRDLSHLHDLLVTPETK